MAEARQTGLIRGRVVCGDQPLEGVRCSDGRQVVMTGRDGRFTIDSSDAGPFVFVVLPRGYWTDAFHASTVEALSREVQFDLQPTGSMDRHSAVYLTDLHLGEGNKERSYSRFAATLDELNSLPDRPAFVLVGGDICLENRQGDRYTELASRLQMPLRHAVGNHELIPDEPDPRARFHSRFGPTYYSFDCGRVHYVILDGCTINPAAEGWQRVEGYVRPRELAWLKNDLAVVPADVPTVVAIHVPLVSTYADRRSMTAADVPFWITRNTSDVLDVLRNHNVPLVLQGHLHENERIYRGSIEFVESASACGNWWRTDGSIETAVSGEPRGYRIIEADGTKVSHRYVSSAESKIDAPGRFVGVEEDRLEAGRNLVVNFFDASIHAEVSGRIDDGAWEPWPAANRPSPLQGLIMAHHWKCPHVPQGRHHVEVRCRDRGRPDLTLSRTIQIG